MKKIFTKGFFKPVALFCAMTLSGLYMTSCEQEDSKDLGDAVLYQNYMLTVSSDGEAVAYAAFSRERNDFLKPVKLTGEQKISVNGKAMNYNTMDSYHMVSYIYSLKLDKGAEEAEFSFVRFKDKTIKNKIKKDNSLSISLPAELETLEAGKAVYWNGAVKAEDEKIEVVMVKENKKQYSEYFGEVTQDGKGFVFAKLPEEKGKFKLTVRRYKTVPTTQNDRTADGEMTLCYQDTKTINLK